MYDMTINLNGREAKIVLPDDSKSTELEMFKKVFSEIFDKEIAEAKTKETIQRRKHITLESDIACLDFSVRTFNCLMRAGIRTVKQLIELPYSELLKVRNLGRNSIDEVLNVCKEIGHEKEIDVTL